MMKIFQRIQYNSFVPRIQKLEGTYIFTRSGVVLFHHAWTFLSIYRNPVVQLRFFVISMFSLFRRGTTRLSLDRSACLIHSGWTAGYYHWITESLPRALLIRDLYPDVIPVLPSEKYLDYINTLKLMGFNEILLYPENKNLILENPVVSECPRQFGTTDPNILKRVRDIIITNCNALSRTDRGRYIYVSRRKARGRFVINEDAVEMMLDNIGFESVCFEDLCFEEQVRLLADTKILISIHGAALTNMIFMREGGIIIELIPRKNGIFDYNIVRNSFRHDPCYVRLSEAMCHRYICLECAADNSWHSGTHMANLIVDVDQLKVLIEKSI